MTGCQAGNGRLCQIGHALYHCTMINFDWNRARAFLATAEHGSFSAAARAMGLTQPTLSRQVDALEAELGVALFERIGKTLIMTRNGQDLLESVRAMGEAADRLSALASGHSEEVQGTIRISVVEVFAAMGLPPIIERLHTAHPTLRIKILPSNIATDVLRRDSDIAIRPLKPEHPDLICRKLRTDPIRLYATPGYIADHPEIRKIADIKPANFIGFATTQVTVEGFAEAGLDLTSDDFCVASDSHLVQWAMVKQGLGIGVMSERIGDAEPLVERFLPDMAPISFPMWLVSHRELRMSRRVRTVYDFLCKELTSPENF
jgi:DNA-binding transcriptional LysR family regulator